MPASIPLEELRQVGPKIAEVEEYIPSASPRYVDWEDIVEPEVLQYVAPGAIHGNSLAVIRAYNRVLGNRNAIPQDAAEEIVSKLNRANVPYRRQQYWEGKLRHDVRGLVRASQEVLSIGFLIVSPIIVILLIQDLILGIMSRAAPQINAFQISFSIKPSTGFLILLALLPPLFEIFSKLFNNPMRYF